MKTGDLLTPNDYMKANGSFIYGIVLEVSCERVNVFLTNGTTHWKDVNSLLDLFDVTEFDEKEK